MIDQQEFDNEVRDDLAFERALFWRGVAAVGIVIVMLVLRQLYFV